MNTNLTSNMWDDPGFLKLSPKAKQVWIYMLTGPHAERSAGGLAPLRFDLMFDVLRRCYGANWITKEELYHAIKECEAEGMASYDANAQVVLIHNWLKYNRPRSPKNMAGWIRRLEEMEPTLLRNEWLDNLRAYCEQWGKNWLHEFDVKLANRRIRVSKKLVDGEPKLFEEKPADKREPDVPGWALEIAKGMAKFIQPKMTRQLNSNDMKRWAESVDKLVRIDGHSQADIKFVCDFIWRKDDFWHTVIMSGQSLRKHFRKIIDKAHRETRTTDDDPFAGLEDS